VDNLIPGSKRKIRVIEVNEHDRTVSKAIEQEKSHDSSVQNVQNRGDAGSDDDDDPWVVLPSAPWYRHCQVAVMLIIMYNCFMVPYRVSFLHYNGDDKAWSVLVIDILSDLYLICDLILAARVAYVEHGYYVCEPALIWRRYLRSHFLVNLVSAIPLGKIACLCESSHWKFMMCFLVHAGRLHHVGSHRCSQSGVPSAEASTDLPILRDHVVSIEKQPLSSAHEII